MCPVSADSTCHITDGVCSGHLTKVVPAASPREVASPLCVLLGGTLRLGLRGSRRGTSPTLPE